jgi:hypothetical protein
MAAAVGVLPEIKLPRNRENKYRPWNPERQTNTAKMTRQRIRREKFAELFNEARKTFGSGRNCFAYSEGVTRRAARRIARRWMKGGAQ